jgi:hypothetical protein
MSRYSRRLRRARRPLLVALLLVLTLSYSCAPALAVVPDTNTVPFIGNAGAFTSAVRIVNNQGAQGTATLFDAHIDVASPNYLNLCFVTADHVMRNTVGGPSYEDDTMPYDNQDNYGGTPAAMQPNRRDFLDRIGIGSQNDPNGFFMVTGNAIIASEVRLGEQIDKLNGKPTDIAFVGITVDLTKLPAAAAAIVSAMPLIPLANPPAAGALPFDVNMKGGYGVTGSFDGNFPLHDYVFHPLAAAEAYGRERNFDTTVQAYEVVNTNVYQYPAYRWNLGLESNAIQNNGDPGAGMPGDSGAAMQLNNTITAILTAGRMDNLGAGRLGIKNGARELGAQITPNALANLEYFCDNYTYATAVPEPSTCVLAAFGAGMIGLTLRRNRRATV